LAGSCEHGPIKYEKCLDQQSNYQLLCSMELIPEGKVNGKKSGILLVDMTEKLTLLFDVEVV
jgi:hypothetical protein